MSRSCVHVRQDLGANHNLKRKLGKKPHLKRINGKFSSLLPWLHTDSHWMIYIPLQLMSHCTWSHHPTNAYISHVFLNTMAENPLMSLVLQQQFSTPLFCKQQSVENWDWPRLFPSHFFFVAFHVSNPCLRVSLFFVALRLFRLIFTPVCISHNPPLFWSPTTRFSIVWLFVSYSHLARFALFSSTLLF